MWPFFLWGVHKHLCGQAHVWACTYRGQRTTPGTILLRLFPPFQDIGSHWPGTHRVG